MNLKILVTGGAGFIGSHLCEALIAAHHHVVVVDDLSSGFEKNLPSGVQFVKGDVRSSDLILELIQSCDACFHLAAIPSVQLSHTDWLLSHSVNLQGSINIFNAAKLLKPKKNIPIIYASSAAVYGSSTHERLDESALCYPLSAYGVDKYSTELHARIAHHIHGLSTLGLRFFNVYGPKQDPHSHYSGVISKFKENLINNQPVTIYGTGTQVRDFIFVEDVVQALISGLSLLLTQNMNLVLNVCTGEGTTINTLAKVMSQILCKPLDTKYGKLLPGDIETSVGSISLILKTLNFKPKFDLMTGLQKLLHQNKSVY